MRRTLLPRRLTTRPCRPVDAPPGQKKKICMWGPTTTTTTQSILIPFLLPHCASDTGRARPQCSTVRPCMGSRRSSRPGARVPALPMASTPGAGEHAPLRRDEEADSGGSQVSRFHGGAPANLGGMWSGGGSGWAGERAIGARAELTTR
jgi:hypothetical protein